MRTDTHSHVTLTCEVVVRLFSLQELPPAGHSLPRVFIHADIHVIRCLKKVVSNPQCVLLQRMTLFE